MNEAIVDLKTSTIISIKNIPNVTGMGLEADDSLSDAIVRSDPNWIALLKKHGISINSVSRRATNLVIKYFTTIENYDYGFIWRFKEDGTLVYPYPATTSPPPPKPTTAFPKGPPPIAPYPTPTSSSGTSPASPTSSAPKNGTSCPSTTSASPSCPSASSPQTPR
ncbi:MAG TPA: hypothetical protein VI233_16815 [Puia sp.]